MDGLSIVVNDLGFLIGVTLLYSSPLIFAALGGVISENAGVVNIGLEGIMVLGAFTAAAVAYFTADPWLGFLAAGVAGAALASLHALATVRFAADHVISGLAINFLGPGVALYTSRLLFQGATQTLTVPNKIPKVFEGVFPLKSFSDLVLRQDATVYLALILAVVLWFVLYHTPLGLRLRAVGEHPHAADALGLSVVGLKTAAVIASGVLAGWGGAAMSIAVVARFSPGLISGHGFIALAAMIFGKWTPHGAVLACLFFGFAKGLEVYLGTRFPVPSTLLALLPYVLTLLTLVGFVGRARPPAAVGRPFVKESA